jgi:hypothetical protein
MRSGWKAALRQCWLSRLREDSRYATCARLQPEGFVVNASSFGSRTPFFIPPALLERGFERQGVAALALLVPLDHERPGRGVLGGPYPASVWPRSYRPCDDPGPFGPGRSAAGRVGGLAVLGICLWGERAELP